MRITAAATWLVAEAWRAVNRLCGRPPGFVVAGERRRLVATPDPSCGAETVTRYLTDARRAHQRYRDAYTSAMAAEVIAGTDARGRRVAAPAVAEVTVLCVTSRPQRLGDVVDNVRRQSPPAGKLLVVCHGAGFDPPAVTGALASIDGGRWMSAPAGWSLGECLNLGIGRCDTRYVAKFDDDDFYGARYLSDALMSAHVSGAALVGKRSYFAHLASQDATLLRFPGKECRPSTYLAGGTLLVDLEQLGELRFPDRTVGEDQDLIRSCLLRGRGVYAGDMFNYVQRRGTHNTWQANDEYLRRKALVVGAGERLDLIEA